MTKRYINKLYLVVFLFLFVLQPFNLFGQEAKQEQIPKIEIRDNLVSAELKDADLSEVLKEIEKGTGVKISVVKELEGKKVSASFTNLDAESALRKLLGNNYVLVFSKEKDKYVLKEVVTAWEDIGARLKGKMTKRDIAYGKGKEEVGRLSEPEVEPRGPESFNNDAKGNVYICDTVNHRIQVFSPIGEHLYSIPLKEGMEANDIAVDRFGSIYVFDAQGKLYQYDKKGNLLKALNIGGWQIRMDMHIVNDNIYMKSIEDKNVKDVLIGKIVNGRLESPTGEDVSKHTNGINAISGRRYLVDLERWVKGEIDILDKSGDTIKSVDLPLNGIVGIQFLQEDKKGNFYIKTEHRDAAIDRLVLEVQKFDPDGNHLATFNIPETDYDSWGIRELSLDEDGNIYQFIPMKEKAQIKIFR